MSKGLTMDERATSHGTDIRMAIEATLNIDPLLISIGEGDITFNAGDDVRKRSVQTKIQVQHPSLN